MVKTAQSVAHRLKEDESGDESGKDARPSERNHVGVQDVGVKVGLHLSPVVWKHRQTCKLHVHTHTHTHTV